MKRVYSTSKKMFSGLKKELRDTLTRQRCLDSYQQRQISQSDCEISSNWGKNVHWRTIEVLWAETIIFMESHNEVKFDTNNSFLLLTANTSKQASSH